ncbi:MAG: ATP cone domain-containing protein, partial [Candidatus Hydrothermarchaeaceae archaeon]
MVRGIRKRDGRISEFDQSRITTAIHKAMVAAGDVDESLAIRLSDKVVELLEREFDGKAPDVESVQDLVEKVLINDGYASVAKAYILYRQKRAEIREAKEVIGVKDDVKLSLNAVKILERRYLRKDEEGKVIESPGEMFRRVAHNVAQADLLYDPNADIAAVEKE